MKIKDLWLKFKNIFNKKLPEGSQISVADNEENIEVVDSAKLYREEMAKQAEEMQRKHFEEILASGNEQEVFKQVLKECGVNSILINNPVSFDRMMEQIKNCAFKNDIYIYNENMEPALKEKISYEDIMKFVGDIKRNYLTVSKNEISYTLENAKTFGGIYSGRKFAIKANEDGTITKKREECYNHINGVDVVSVQETKEESTFDKNGIEIKTVFEERKEEEMPYLGYSSKGGQVTNYYAEAQRDPEDITKVVFKRNDESFLIDLVKTPYIGQTDLNDIATLNGIKRYFGKDKIDVNIFYNEVQLGSQAYEERKSRISELAAKSEYPEGCMNYGNEMMRE